MRGQTAGTSFQFFPGGGKILTDFLGGQNMKKTKKFRQKHKIVTIFQNQKGANAPPRPPPK